MKYYYPAVFEPMDNDPDGYVLTVPDVAGCVTQGYTLDEAMYMAHDAIGTLLDDTLEAQYPAPSNVNDISLDGFAPGSFVSLVCFDKDKWDRDTIGINGARERAGLSIKALADLLEAPYRTVQDWCRGKRNPPPWLQKLVIAEIERAAK